MASLSTRTCLWCGEQFSPTSRRGPSKKFCKAQHRMAYWRGLVAVAAEFLAAGTITTDELRAAYGRARAVKLGRTKALYSTVRAANSRSARHGADE